MPKIFRKTFKNKFKETNINDLYQSGTMSHSEMKNAWRRNLLSKVRYSGGKSRHTIPQTTLRLTR